MRYWLIFGFYALFLMLMSACKSFEIFSDYIWQMERLAGGDKYFHLQMAAILSWLFLRAVKSCSIARDGKFKGALWKVPLALSVLLAALIADEVSQFYFVTRHYDVSDIYFGAVGLLIGAAFFGLSIRLKYCFHKQVIRSRENC